MLQNMAWSLEFILEWGLKSLLESFLASILECWRVYFLNSFQKYLLFHLQKEWARVVFVCPSDFWSPYFFEYTNDVPLKPNFRLLNPPSLPTPPPIKKKPQRINHILVQFLHRDFFLSWLLNLGSETIILLAFNL